MRKLSAKFFLLMLIFWIGWSGAANATNAISLDKIGTGQGSVTSTNDGDINSKDINCGSTCAGTFPPVNVYTASTGTTTTRNVNVSFTAIANAGSVFKGWFLNDNVTPWPNCGTRMSCSISATAADQQLTAKFDIIETPVTIPTVSFTVLNEGSGSDYGLVKSSADAPGINCMGQKYDSTSTPACLQSYSPGTNVTLNASANKVNGAYFAGWKVYFDGNNTLTTGLQTNMCLGLEPTCNITIPSNVVTVQVRATYNLGYILTLQGKGQGSGTFLSSSDNLQSTCSGSVSDPSCIQTYNANRIVNVTALPDQNSGILNWTIDGVVSSACGTATTCAITMNTAHLVVANFSKLTTGSYTAYIIKDGSGTGFGTVTASTTPPIKCDSTSTSVCSATFSQSIISFNATPDKAGVTFAGWKVQFKRYLPDLSYVWDDYPTLCTGLQPVCQVSVSSDIRVWATFNYDIILSLVKDGTGSGSVITSSQPLTDCAKAGGTNNICSQTFVGGQGVTLTAVPDLKSEFVQWKGCASTADSNQDGTLDVCTVTMDQAKVVTATFAIINSAKLSVTLDPNGTGTGTVKSDLLGLNCGTTCSRNYAFNTVVTLTATPFPGSEFVGWSGDWCSGLESTCKVTMDQAKNVIARFDTGFKLTLNKQGEGDGTVFSDPAGINCGTTCAYSFTNATTIKLTANPVNGSTFLGWGGACSGTQLTCMVSMTQAQTVAVTFSGVGFGKAVDNTNLIWTSTGDAPWFGQLQKDAKVKTTYANGSAGVSGLITHNQSSVVQTTVTGPANLSFAWKVSSEKDRDELHFEIDGKEIQKISGEVDWTQVKQALSSGKHLLRWTYIKDADLSMGADSGWLDQVQVSQPDGGLTPNTLTIINNGSGTVVSNPSGISCGGACSADFSLNTAVLLTANPQGNTQFAGWSGACNDTKPTCLVTMNGSQTVVALFNTTGGSGGNTLNKAVLNLGLLNDTGIDWCADKSNAYMSNKSANCDALMATFPWQDGQVGRDAANRKAQLAKIGSGDVGFDYSKICNNGKTEGSSNCPANQTVLGANANQWGCTRDNVTGLIWEVKTIGGSRDKDQVYTWYNANDRSNGGNKGDNCTSASCNTASFVQAVNQVGLCGANDWRLPTRQELHSMVHHGRNNSPAVDIANFPNTTADNYWSATPMAAFPLKAWLVNFDAGWDFGDNKSSKQHVRLVRQCDGCTLATTNINPVYGNSVLHLRQVTVENNVYEAWLKLVSANPMVFELSNAQLKSLPVGASAIGNQVRYYSNGSLVVNNVAVDTLQYNATLQIIPGSNPMQFKLVTAVVTQ